MIDQSSPQISTTVRPNPSPARAASWVRQVGLRALSGVEALSPRLAARLVMPAMFRTRRRAVAPSERVISEQAERFTVAPGIVAYRWGAGPQVLLVHGWNSRASQLSAFVPPLVSAGYQVVAFDAPGHGASRGSSSSIIAFADAIDAVVDATRPLFQPLRGIIAHSLGGAAVTLAMSRSRGFSGSTESECREQRPPRLVFIAPPIDMREITRSYGEALGLQSATRAVFDLAVEQHLGARFDDVHALHLARKMYSPLLVLHDEQDRAVPLDSGQRLAEAWRGAKICVTRGLGHSRILRDEKSVGRAIDFLRA